MPAETMYIQLDRPPEALSGKYLLLQIATHNHECSRKALFCNGFLTNQPDPMSGHWAAFKRGKLYPPTHLRLPSAPIATPKNIEGNSQHHPCRTPQSYETIPSPPACSRHEHFDSKTTFLPEYGAAAGPHTITSTMHRTQNPLPRSQVHTLEPHRSPQPIKGVPVSQSMSLTQLFHFSQDHSQTRIPKR